MIGGRRHTTTARVARLVSDALAQTLADMIPGICERHGVDHDEALVALTHALAMNVAATVVVAAPPLPDTKAFELAQRINTTIATWLEEQQIPT